MGSTNKHMTLCNWSFQIDYVDLMDDIGICDWSKIFTLYKSKIPFNQQIFSLFQNLGVEILIQRNHPSLSLTISLNFLLILSIGQSFRLVVFKHFSTFLVNGSLISILWCTISLCLSFNWNFGFDSTQKITYMEI